MLMESQYGSWKVLGEWVSENCLLGETELEN